MIRQAIILCGGLGSRLGTLTMSTPKPLLPVAGRPFLEILIEEIARQGIKEILLLASFASEQIEHFAATLGERLALDISVSISVEPERAGTGGAIFHARDKLHEVFYLFNGDSWFDTPLATMWLLLQADPQAAGVLGLRSLAESGRYGVVRLDGQVVTDFLPKSDSLSPALVNSGVYLFRSSIVNIVPQVGSFEEVTLPALAAVRTLRATSSDAYFIDIGIPADYERAQFEIPRQRMRAAVFFDRDGVLNRDDGHVGEIERFVWIEGAREAVKLANDRGFYTFIVTNQAGIAKGKFSVEDYLTLYRHMQSDLMAVGAHIDDHRYCAFHPEATVEAFRGPSDWRKPGPGMLLDLMKRWPVDRNASFMIGDQLTDMAAAEAAGITGHRFQGGNLEAFIDPLLGAGGR